VTELLDGSDLKGLLQGKPLPPKKVVEYSLQVLEGWPRRTTKASSIAI
jgi:hypothetical protein